jgi:hypothetical protein
VLDARQAQADVALAKADKQPDWSWEVAYQRRDPMFGDMVSAGVSISLPLWGKSRQDPMIAARTASACATHASARHRRASASFRSAVRAATSRSTRAFCFST